MLSSSLKKMHTTNEKSHYPFVFVRVGVAFDRWLGNATDYHLFADQKRRLLPLLQHNHTAIIQPIKRYAQH